MRTTKEEPLEVTGKMLNCLNHPRVQSPFWVGREAFCDEMRTLVAEIKEQIAMVWGGQIPQTEARRWRARYERHRRVFAEVKMHRALFPDYRSAEPVLSVGADDNETDRIAVLYTLLTLIERSEMDYLRQCEVCQRWYIATKSDQKTCGVSCRKKKSRNTDGYREQRRENYALKKKQQERKKR